MRIHSGGQHNAMQRSARVLLWVQSWARKSSEPAWWDDAGMDLGHSRSRPRSCFAIELDWLLKSRDVEATRQIDAQLPSLRLEAAAHVLDYFRL